MRPVWGIGRHASVLGLGATGRVEIVDTIMDGNIATDSTGSAILAVPNGGSLEVAITGGSITSNTAAKTGGALCADGAVITGQDVDMGSGATNNTPADIRGCDLELGAGASFLIDAATATPCVER